MATKKPVFETSLAELEKLVQRLEQAEIPLAEAIGAFEKGQKLIQTCEHELQAAEQLVKQLLSNGEDFEESPLQIQ
jgi:exodeoxyribonuclease VII small subunit